MADAPDNGSSTNTGFTPSVSLSEDGSQTILKLSESETRTIPTKDYVQQWQKGGGFDKQGQELGTTRSQLKEIQKKLETYEGLYGGHFEKLSKLPEDQQRAALAHIDKWDAQTAPKDDDPLAGLFGGGNAKPNGDYLSRQDAEKMAAQIASREVDLALRSRDTNGRMEEAISKSGVSNKPIREGSPLMLYDVVKDAALREALRSDTPPEQLVGEIMKSFIQADEDRIKAATKQAEEEKLRHGPLGKDGFSATGSGSNLSNLKYGSPEFVAALAARAQARLEASRR